MSANGRRAYTVKHVAELSGVSVRTLRFYDEIGLLKPASLGANGYRYYGTEQLLILQQILFYRELGFELAVIQKIMSDPEFDKVAALRAHRERLAKEIDRTVVLVATLDKTLAHLEGEAPMKADEMYVGFDPKKLEEFEKWGRERFGDAAATRWQQAVEESRERTKHWGRAEFDQVHRDYDELHKSFSAALEHGLASDAQDVQDLVRRHLAIVKRFWTPNRAAYVGLGNTYCEHPDFRRVYDRYHPRLAEYLRDAMKAFAERELKA